MCKRGNPARSTSTRARRQLVLDRGGELLCCDSSSRLPAGSSTASGQEPLLLFLFSQGAQTLERRHVGEVLRATGRALVADQIIEADYPAPHTLAKSSVLPPRPCF